MSGRREMDEPVKIDLPPDDALRGLLAVDPEAEPESSGEDESPEDA